MGVAERDSGLEDEPDIDTEEDESEGEQGEPEADEGAGEPEGEPDARDGSDEGEEQEVVIQIGDEAPPASEDEAAAPKWVKNLREEQRRLKKENAELRAKVGAGQPETTQAPTLPPKPTLAACDYDEDEYQAKTEAWHAKKREVEAHEASQRSAEDARKKAAQAIDDAYAASRTALKVKDYAQAEEDAAAALSPVQQALIKAGSTNPALIVYALGKNPKKLAELSSIKDPVKFAVALGKLETEVKVTKRSSSTKPAPETTVRKGSGSAPATSATLDRLRAEAEKTGDRSKVAAYLRTQRAPGK